MRRAPGQILILTLAWTGNVIAGAPQMAAVADGVRVYSRMSVTSEVATTLQKGQAVTIQMTVADSTGCWLDVAWRSKPLRSGFVKCSDLEPAVPLLPSVDAPVAPKLTAGLARWDKIDLLLMAAGVTRMIYNATDAEGTRSLMKLGGMDEKDPRFKQVFERVNRPGVLYAPIRAHFEGIAEDARIMALIGQLHQPFLQRVMALSAESISSKSRAEYSRYAAAGAKQIAASPARNRLMERLERATDSVQCRVESQVAATRGAVLALNRILPTGKEISSDELEKVLERVRAESFEDAARVVRAAGLYGYASLTDDEMKQYVEFAESEAARWFYLRFNETFHQAVETMADKLVSGLANLRPAVP